MTEGKRNRDPFARAYWTRALVVIAAIIGGGRRGR